MNNIYTFKNIFIVHYKSKCGVAGLYLCKFKYFFKYIGIFIKSDFINNKAIAMMRKKSPRSENIYLIENHCQANISK